MLWTPLVRRYLCIFYAKRGAYIRIRLRDEDMETGFERMNFMGLTLAVFTNFVHFVLL